MSPQIKFIVAVAKHWGALVTGGVIIGLISVWQGTGHNVPHYIYWSVAFMGLVLAFYRTWWDEHQQIVNVTAALARQEQQVASLTGFWLRRPMWHVS